ncbi:MULTISPECIES: hypothetical protein [unclassified Streptomyces]|uniref:hypothetical protein n=1 Tax=unclassified Streptomyces TaxID=2593676 RepID=UPI002367272F|nr:MULTISPECIES: hypothetical protein [unclassified Streptomyces]MDF3141424.1 hypothetical protein [Streptomyces sp. T21Q-yed]WDF35313.1 hypothetical protein PBV52_00060 [Streptomyces sp. T12]WDF44475.1 hypothetical protein PBV52_50740 [Streptomyces sp. T12]
MRLVKRFVTELVSDGVVQSPDLGQDVVRSLAHGAGEGADRCGVADAAGGDPAGDVVHADDEDQLVFGGGLGEFTDQVCGQVLGVVNEQCFAVRVAGEVGCPLPRVTPAGVVAQPEHFVAVLEQVAQGLVGGDGLAAAAVPVEDDRVIAAERVSEEGDFRQPGAGVDVGGTETFSGQGVADVVFPGEGEHVPRRCGFPAPDVVGEGGQGGVGRGGDVVVAGYSGPMRQTRHPWSSGAMSWSTTTRSRSE